jgi:hypothetical protein
MTMAGVVARLRMLARSKFLAVGGFDLASVKGSNGGLEVVAGNRLGGFYG